MLLMHVTDAVTDVLKAVLCLTTETACAVEGCALPGYGDPLVTPIRVRVALTLMRPCALLCLGYCAGRA